MLCRTMAERIKKVPLPSIMILLLGGQRNAVGGRRGGKPSKWSQAFKHRKNIRRESFENRLIIEYLLKENLHVDG